MLRIERPDYRRSKEAELLEGLRSHDPLALAEVYHRTSPAAHACARRLLGGAREAEALMHAVYGELWASPPETARLEGWVRSRCFRVGTDYLRAHDQPPASRSLALLLPDLPEPTDPSHDPAEETLAALPEEERRALLLAHDQGMPTSAQDDPDAVAGLDRALMALAGPGEGADDGSTDACADVTGMADWTLGLLAADHAADVTAAVIDRPACASRSRALRRGRRRLEGLPPAPDLGQRVLASVLGSSTASPPHVELASPGSPGATDAPSRPAASSSLGGAPPSPIPAARIPSALDDEPPAEDSVDAPTDDSPAAPPSDTETLTPQPAAESGTGREADVGTAEPDEVPDAVDDGADGGGRAVDEEAGPVGAEDEDASAAAALPVTEDATARQAAPAKTRKERSLARKLLNVVVIIVVLAAGAGLGLLIGFLLVGGR